MHFERVFTKLKKGKKLCQMTSDLIEMLFAVNVKSELAMQ